MAETAKKIATYSDIEALPKNVVGEIVYGSLVTHPRPAPPHARAQFSLSYELEGPFNRGKGGPGGWIFFTEPELHLGANVIVPDLAGWKSERLPNAAAKAWIETSPDWVCEIISPSTERVDRAEKRQIYLEFGVPFLWLLDPRAKLLECFTLRTKQWVLSHTFELNQNVSAPPFEAASFDLSKIFLSDWPESTSE